MKFAHFDAKPGTRPEGPYLESIHVYREIDTDPDLSYLEQNYHSGADCSAENAAEDAAYEEQDRQRLAAYHREEWWCVGIRAVAEISLGGKITRIGQTVESGGLWGIESDSEESYFEEVAREELTSLRQYLGMLNVPVDDERWNELCKSAVANILEV